MDAIKNEPVRIRTTISIDPFTAPWKYRTEPIYPYQSPDLSTAYCATQWAFPGPATIAHFTVPAMRPEEV